ncbi:hypothetical protein BDAP_002089 [Binucleata daphniae]
MVLLHLLCIQTINIIFNKDDKDVIIYEDVIEKQLCNVYFKPNSTYNCKYTIKIMKKSNTKPTFESVLLEGKENWFMFNVVRSDQIIITLEPEPINKKIQYRPGKIEVTFTSEVDTYGTTNLHNKELEPSVLAVEKIQNITTNLLLETEKKIQKFYDMQSEYKKYIKVVIFSNLMCFLVFLVFTFYEIYKVKKFFKNKKLL